jgi:hypothetical protein
MLLLVTLLLLEAVLLAFSLRRSGFVPFPHLLLITMMGYQLSIYFVANDILSYQFLRTFSTSPDRNHYAGCQLLFAAIFIVSYFLFLPGKNIRYWQRLQKSVRFNMSSGSAAIAIGFIWLYHIVLFFLINWSLVWSNDRYLLMNGPGVMGTANPFTTALIRIFPLVGLTTFVILAVYAGRGRIYVLLSLMPLALFNLAYQTGAHSRKAVLFILIYAGLRYMVRKDRTSLILGSVLGAVVLVFCLGGRGYSDQGISTIFSPGATLAAYFSDNPGEAFLNIFEGAFSTTELFNRAYAASTQYKILSFSPLPSFIDGFDSVRLSQMHKLGPFSPPSAVFEVWSFGGLYIFGFVLVQAIVGRVVVKALKRSNDLLAISANAMMAVATYLEFTFPIRTIFRFVFVALALALVAHYFSLYRRRAATSNPQLRAHGMPSGTRHAPPRPLGSPGGRRRVVRVRQRAGKPLSSR